MSCAWFPGSRFKCPLYCQYNAPLVSSIPAASMGNVVGIFGMSREEVGRSMPKMQAQARAFAIGSGGGIAAEVDEGRHAFDPAKLLPSHNSRTHFARHPGSFLHGRAGSVVGQVASMAA